jgi:hypothetical protein
MHGFYTSLYAVQEKNCKNILTLYSIELYQYIWIISGYWRTIIMRRIQNLEAQAPVQLEAAPP